MCLPYDPVMRRLAIKQVETWEHIEQLKDMATVKKGLLTKSGEWAKHLKKRFRRAFWKGERQAGKKLIRKVHDK